MSNRFALMEFDQAREVGFSPTRAARWVAYRLWKASRDERPITLAEAARQVEAARR
jgi:hypothetical protein